MKSELKFKKSALKSENVLKELIETMKEKDIY